VRVKAPSVIGYILYKIDNTAPAAIQYDYKKATLAEAERLGFKPVVNGMVKAGYFYDSLPVNNARCCYAVSAIDISGMESGLSTITAAPLQNNIDVKAPAGIFTRNVKEGIKITWIVMNNDTSGQIAIYRRNIASQELKKIATVDTKATVYIDTTVEKGVLYIYYITAVRDDKETGPSANKTLRRIV